MKLLPQKQRVEHDPENGKWGDCYRTCVAVILGVPAEEVPHVLEKGTKNIKDIDGLIAMREWLLTKDLAISKSVYNGDLDWSEFKSWMAQFNPNSACIVTGDTTRDTTHCVVMVGGEVICDPITGEENPEPFYGAAKCDNGEFLWFVEVITPAIASKI